MARGRVVAAGSAEDLRGGPPRRFRLVLGGDAGWTRGFGRVQVLDVDGPTALVEPFDAEAAQALLREALLRGAVHEFSPVVPALSELYREVAA
jgi:ABC-2 type transport system ATP-binding protein